MATRATYLKQTSKLSIAQFASTIAAIHVATLLSNAMLVLALFGWFKDTNTATEKQSV